MSSVAEILGPEASGFSPGDLIVAARLSFWTFFELTFEVLHPGEELADADYFVLIDHLLDSCHKRRQRRLILNMPPGYMKSTLVSVYFTAWLLGQDPTTKIICASYGDDLAHLLSRRVRDLMQSAIYRRIFPATILAKKAEDLLTTTKGGQRYATAVGSDITGFRADYIIIDDPLQPIEATSELAKEKVRTWFDSSVLSRFKDPALGVLILVMHRVAPDDLSGTLEEQDGWLAIKLPLVAEKQELFRRAGDKLVLFERNAGELLCPARMTHAQFKSFKAETAPHVFAAQYQQRPTHGASGMCSIERLVRYDTAPPFEVTMHSWDVAATVDGDYTVCTQWGAAREGKRDTLYLTNIIRLRAEAPDVRDMILGQDQLLKPDLVVVDGVGIGLGIVQELRKGGMKHVMPVGDTTAGASNATKTQKLMRAIDAVSYTHLTLPTNREV